VFHSPNFGDFRNPILLILDEETDQGGELAHQNAGCEGKIITVFRVL
jgi:hypothetical protein